MCRGLESDCWQIISYHNNIVADGVQDQSKLTPASLPDTRVRKASII